MTSPASSPIATTSPEISSMRAWVASSVGRRRSRTPRTIERHRSSLRRTGWVTSRSWRTWLKSICCSAIAASPSSVQTLAGPPRSRMTRESSESTPSSHRAASAMVPASRPPTATPATSRVSGVTPNENTCPLLASVTAVRRRSSDARIAGWSGGYSAQPREAATSDRARAETLRETSGDRVGASAMRRENGAVNYTLGASMRAVDLIRTKRDGGLLDRAALEWFVAGVTDGSLPDYQASALLMAIVLRGMTPEETAALTDAMVRSGVRVQYSGLPHVAVDKHSTGGVGDKTSIILAPLAAACGAPVPMMSGRGLGHTGGTLDKLESIPGFRTALSLDELRHSVASIGCALVGQTSEVAPADRKLYALRDVTGTVESIPLITASIMSKKIAEGIGGLVLDVKYGDGAFMKTEADARQLAESLVAIGELAGVRTEALLTNMDAPLGRAVGNALEIVESIETLKGRGPADLESLSIEFATRMLVLSGVEKELSCATDRVRQALSSGAGVEKLRQIIRNQGGDPAVVDDYAKLPAAPDRGTIAASRDGVVVAMRAEAVGRAAVGLGAGRDRLDATIDPAVGFTIAAPVGTRVKRGDPIIEIHHRGGRGLAEARRLLESSIVIGDAAPKARPLVLDRIKGRTA